MANDTLNNDKSTMERYFAAEDAEKLASTCLSKSTSFYNILTMNYYLDNLVRMWLFIMDNTMPPSPETAIVSRLWVKRENL